MRSLVAALGLTFLLAGCGRTEHTHRLGVDPDEQEFIAVAAAVSRLPKGKSIAVENAGAPGAFERVSPRFGPDGEVLNPTASSRNYYLMDLRETSEAAVILLRRALEENGLGSVQPGSRTVKISIRSLAFPDARAHRNWTKTEPVAASLTLIAELDNGTSLVIGGYAVSRISLSSGYQIAFKGALTNAVFRLVGDEKFKEWASR